MDNKNTLNQDQLNVITQSYTEEINRLLNVKANLGLQILALTKKVQELTKEVEDLKKEKVEIKEPIADPVNHN